MILIHIDHVFNLNEKRLIQKISESFRIIKWFYKNSKGISDNRGPGKRDCQNQICEKFASEKPITGRII